MEDWQGLDGKNLVSEKRYLKGGTSGEYMGRRGWRRCNGGWW